MLLESSKATDVRLLYSPFVEKTACGAKFAKGSENVLEASAKTLRLEAFSLPVEQAVLRESCHPWE